MSARVIGCIAAWLVALPALAFDVPYLSGRIVDEANLLSEAAESRLTARLAALESETGAQVAVLTVPTLGGEPIEDASMQVVETWKLGRADVDDGVLLFVARDERALRIEVGYALEGALPDARARRIIDAAIVPRFKAGDFEGGIDAGVAEIEGALRGEADTLPPPDTWPGGSGFRDPGALPSIPFLAVLLSFAFYAIAVRGREGWLFLVFLTFFIGVFAMSFLGPPYALPAGGAWLVVGSILRLLWPERWRVEPTRGRHGSIGGYGGWSSRGGGFGGGGGFSGGGGSFGGGGASGRW